MAASYDVITIGNTSLRIRKQAIHFYYGDAERQRLLSFLESGLENGEGAVFACPAESSAVLYGRLKTLHKQGDGRFLQVMLSESSAAGNVGLVVIAATHLLAKVRTVRVIADFGSLNISRSEIRLIEAEFRQALRDGRIRFVTQYDGRAVPTPTILEQFADHELTVVGNVLYHELEFPTGLPERMPEVTGVGAGAAKLT